MTDNSDRTYERGATLHSECACCEHAAEEIERLAARIHDLENVIETLHGRPRRERITLNDADSTNRQRQTKS